jgi:hypothetical protein
MGGLTPTFELGSVSVGSCHRPSVVTSISVGSWHGRSMPSLLCKNGISVWFHVTINRIVAQLKTKWEPLNVLIDLLLRLDRGIVLIPYCKCSEMGFGFDAC